LVSRLPVLKGVLLALAQLPRTQFQKSSGFHRRCCCGELGMATILIVENQEQILMLAKSFLEEQGHKTGSR